MGAHLQSVATGKVGRIVMGLAALACAGAAAVSHGSERAGVQRVRFGGDMRETRLVIELGRSVHPKFSTNDSPLELTLALPDVGLAGELDGQGHGLVRSWSMARAGSAARLKLVLNGPAQIRRRFLLAPSEGSPAYRYVVDLAAAGAPPAVAAAGRPRMVAVRSTPERARKVIVIDAGHGGKDPGAHGVGVQEKSVTLQAAQALKARLEKTGRYRVVLTRASDEYVPLQTRVQIARSADADLFISLHADAGPDATLRGATVYTLSDEGSDRAARRAIDQRDYFLNVSLPGGDRAVNQILLDLTQRVTKNRSSVLAESLVERVGRIETMSHRSHRNAGFVVLLAPDVPAVLLEMGFITNPLDEASLADPRRQMQMMDAVARSIDDYFVNGRKVTSS